ncbi:MAG: gliding motility-associated C-terminal domain-containing protein [Bacteroidota bacterium]
MNEPKNIEELFQSAFENYEADPGISWQAMQAKLGSQAATSSAAAGTTSVITGKIILVAAAVVVVAGLGITYALWPEETPKEQPKEKKETVMVTPADEKAEQPLTKENETVTAENSIIIEQKDEATNKTSTVKITVKEKEPKQNMYESVVDRWMTPRDEKEKNLANYHHDNKNNTSANDTYTDPVRFNNIEIQVENVTENKPAAAILASLSGGHAPLTVDFSNQVEGDFTCDWNFDDGKTSEETKTRHTFEQPGVYVVTLTVKDKKGNKSYDKVVIEVTEGESDPAEQSSIKNINIITPNGDNVNDYLMLESENIKDIYFLVFDGKGAVLFETSDVNFKWDGTDKSGTLLPAGKYFYRYKATGNDGKQYTDLVQFEIRY